MAHQTFFKSDMPTRVDRKIAKVQAEAANWRAVCKLVDARDHRTCRACGKKTNPDDLGLLRGHRHHVQYRSQMGEDSAENLITLCAGCHSHEHVTRQLRIEILNGELGTNGPCEFWRLNKDDEWYLSKRELDVHRIEKD